ncbi:5-oxoprolinase subunit PxpB [Paenibacillus sp. M1]|uniref:5-oxoprolinase subunit PxpB n=1 Tax=Paenibacillus haidiansis TaxID=1574488 RepID=A0ABU7VSA9_9BACL
MSELQTSLGYRIVPLGDSALNVCFGDRVDPVIYHRVKQLADHLDRHPLPGMIEYVPAYATVTIYYDPLALITGENGGGETKGDTAFEASGKPPFDTASSLLHSIMAKLGDAISAAPRTVEIPVCYGGDLGPDLETVAAYHGLTEDEVIDIHTSADYLVYMLGFAPGFGYLGGLSGRIATPRRETPRLSIPAGSVGIAGDQTGIYPLDTPGGWQLIGRTPVRLFMPERMPPTLLEAGDHVRFCRITREEYDAWGGDGL